MLPRFAKRSAKTNRQERRVRRERQALGSSRQSFEGCAFDGSAEGSTIIPSVFGCAEAHALFVAFAAGDDNIAGLRHLAGLIKRLPTIWHADEGLSLYPTLTDAAL